MSVMRLEWSDLIFYDNSGKVILNSLMGLNLPGALAQQYADVKYLFDVGSKVGPDTPVLSAIDNDTKEPIFAFIHEGGPFYEISNFYICKSLSAPISASLEENDVPRHDPRFPVDLGEFVSIEKALFEGLINDNPENYFFNVGARMSGRASVGFEFDSPARAIEGLLETKIHTVTLEMDGTEIEHSVNGGKPQAFVNSGSFAKLGDSLFELLPHCLLAHYERCLERTSAKEHNGNFGKTGLGEQHTEHREAFAQKIIEAPQDVKLLFSSLRSLVEMELASVNSTRPNSDEARQTIQAQTEFLVALREGIRLLESELDLSNNSSNSEHWATNALASVEKFNNDLEQFYNRSPNWVKNCIQLTSVASFTALLTVAGAPAWGAFALSKFKLLGKQK